LTSAKYGVHGRSSPGEMLHAPPMLLQKRRAVSNIIRMRDMMLLVCSFLVIQGHVLSHDGADLRIHVALMTNNKEDLVHAGTKCITIIVLTSKSSPTCDRLQVKTKG